MNVLSKTQMLAMTSKAREADHMMGENAKWKPGVKAQVVVQDFAANPPKSRANMPLFIPEHACGQKKAFSWTAQVI